MTGRFTKRKIVHHSHVIQHLWFKSACLLFPAFAPFVQQGSAQAKYTLKPTPKTVAWGYYDAKVAPVLRVKSGDTVEIQTLITNSPKRLEEAGPPPEQRRRTPRGSTGTASE